jgi:hypothetical protein
MVSQRNGWLTKGLGAFHDPFWGADAVTGVGVNVKVNEGAHLGIQLRR